MFKPKEIKEKDLPLFNVGQEKGSFKSIYKLIGLLDSDIQLSLKYNGYKNKKAVLQSGEVLESAWVK